MRPNQQTWWGVAQTCIIALLLIGCDSTAPAAPEVPEQPATGLRLEARSDTAFTGTVGTTLATVPVVRLTTLDGNPAPGREIRFSASSGGSIEVAIQRTDTAGLASPGTWTLGTTARPQTLTARADGVTDLVFTAVVDAGQSATMEIVAGNFQTAPAGAPLPIVLQVRLADRYGNPVPEEPMSYTVLMGNGTVLGDTVKTDSLGFARSGTWTLGGEGPQLVRASTAGKELLFEALACKDACRAPTLLITKEGGLYTLDNGVATRVHDSVGDAAWSPDGQQFAFSIYNGMDDISDLYLMDADGSNVALRASGFFSSAWSPDGQRLAATGPVGVYTLSVGQGDTQPVLLAEHAQHPAWSPDGTKIAYVEFENGDGQSFKLKVMNADGSAVTTLVNGDEHGMSYPAWSPDGQRVAFTKCDAVGCHLFAVNANGADLVQLTTPNDGPGLRPVWSPDGSWIAFNSGGGIVWVPADGSFSTPIPMIPLIPGAGILAWRQ